VANDMNLIASLLPLSNVVVDLEANSKKRAFEQAGQLFEKNHQISHTQVFDSLFAREKLGSTGLGQGVAIPHGRIKGLSSALGAFIKFRSPVPFDAPDNKPVCLLFILLVPEHATDLHLQLLSELALELITRGHRLIADDMVEIYHVAPGTLEGRCPPLLQDFLEVRGLGILSIRALFGETAVKLQKNLKLIVQLEKPTDLTEDQDRLGLHTSSQQVLGVSIPTVRIPVAAGRNLAVLVEVAARNHILKNRGINSAEQFVERQQQQIFKNGE